MKKHNEVTGDMRRTLAYAILIIHYLALWQSNNVILTFDTVYQD